MSSASPGRKAMPAESYLRTAAQLVQQRRIDDAIAHLRQGIRTLRAQGDLAGVSSLACTAAEHCTQRGDLHAAATLYEDAARAAPDDPYTQLAIGDTYAMMGDDARSTTHWNRFSEMASASMDPDLLELLAAHLARRQRLKR
ncbi:MAG: hypothetical protein ABIY55_18965 [Kofleriaceae bacterium]